MMSEETNKPESIETIVGDDVDTIKVFKITETSGNYGPIYVNGQSDLNDTLEFLANVEHIYDIDDGWQLTINAVWVDEEKFKALEPVEW